MGQFDHTIYWERQEKKKANKAFFLVFFCSLGVAYRWPRAATVRRPDLFRDISMRIAGRSARRPHPHQRFGGRRVVPAQVPPTPVLPHPARGAARIIRGKAEGTQGVKCYGGYPTCPALAVDIRGVRFTPLGPSGREAPFSSKRGSVRTQGSAAARAAGGLGPSSVP